MDSPGSARVGAAHLPIHLQQPSSSSYADPEVFASTHNIKPGQSFISVQTLTKESFHIAVNAKTKVHDVLWKCGERLSLSEDKLFGLAFRQPTEGIGGDQPRHEYYFLDPAAKILKYAQKQPRFANWNNRSSENRPILVLYFRVRVYIDQVGLLTCPRAREHYYLQLKDNFLDHWAGRHSVSEERCWYMSALALITDKGSDYMGYFRPEQYFPSWVISERGLEYILNNIPAACEDIINEDRDKAMEKFMVEAGRSPFALNCHLYGLRRHKMDNVDNAVLGINAKGIEMCDISEHGDRIPLRSLLWNKVTRLSFDRKKITIIGSDGTKMSLYAQTEHKAKYLLELCRAVHQTLLVMSHLYATMAPPAPPYQEMSVDGISTSSTSGIGSGDHDKDSDSLSSACGDRCHGSISSKLRMRIKMDSNLDVKIEKMELEHIRQERAASQSSKASDESDRSRIDLRPANFHPDKELSNATSSTYTVTTGQDTTTRPSSIDNASQTIETGSNRSIVDVNFNKRDRDRFSATSPNMTFTLNGSVSTHQSAEHWEPSDADRLQSISFHDLRAMNIGGGRSYSPPNQQQQQHQASTAPYYESTPLNETEMSAKMRNEMTRSETRIDSNSAAEIWARHANLDAFEINGPSSAGGRFVKKNSAGSRTANAINRVHSMPSHYHMNGNGYYRANQPMINNIYDDSPMYHGPTSLSHAQSLHTPSRPRNPPPYEHPTLVTSTTTPIMTPTTSASKQPGPTSSSLPNGPLPAEAANGQPSFPPASATLTQFVPCEDDSFSTEKIQDCPLLMQLWKEHRMSQGQLNQMVPGVTSFSGLNGTQSHKRRPSSCTDLTLMDTIGAAASFLPSNVMYRPSGGDYFFTDSVAIPQNTTGSKNPLLMPMPPPPVTSNVTSVNGSSNLVKTNFTRVEQHNGNLHLPPPPPYQQPQQLVN